MNASVSPRPAGTARFLSALPTSPLLTSLFLPSLLLTSCFLLLTSPLAACAATSTPFACNPYSFVGRISDARSTAFDDTRRATLSAAAADGTKLAETSTFHRSDSRNNYFLQIPVASAEVPGYALVGDTLVVSAVDDLNQTWTGVIDPAMVGAPGTVSTVDIVLAEDADGDGIDDALYAELEAQWAASESWREGETFDPYADHDGDGMDDLAEARLGTDPFDASDVLHIDGIALDQGEIAVSAELPGGHAYALQTTETLGDAASWTDEAFYATETAPDPQGTLVTPASAARGPYTVYLLPGTNAAPVFYRLRVTDLSGTEP